MTHFKNIIGGVTQSRLDEIEQIIGRQLPKEYKDFLLNFNGSKPVFACFPIVWQPHQEVEGWGYGTIDYFLSVVVDTESDFLSYNRTFKGRIPDNTVVIAHDPGRDIVLLGTDTKNFGKVFFWVAEYEVDEGEDVNYSNVGFIANSFNEFLGLIYYCD